MVALQEEVQSSRFKTGDIEKKKEKERENVQRNGGARGWLLLLFCFFAISSAEVLERYTPSSCICWTSLIFMPSSLTSHVERLNRKPYNGEGPVPITRLT